MSAWVTFKGSIAEKVDWFRGLEKPFSELLNEAIASNPIEKFNYDPLLNVLQELGGWSDYKMVLRYAHLAPEHLSEHANRLNGIVAKSVAVDKVTKLKFR